MLLHAQVAINDETLGGATAPRSPTIRGGGAAYGDHQPEIERSSWGWTAMFVRLSAAIRAFPMQPGSTSCTRKGGIVVGLTNVKGEGRGSRTGAWPSTSYKYPAVGGPPSRDERRNLPKARRLDSYSGLELVHLALKRVDLPFQCVELRVGYC